MHTYYIIIQWCQFFQAKIINIFFFEIGLYIQCSFKVRSFHGSVKITIIKILLRSFEAWNVCTFYFKLLWLIRICKKYFVDTNFSFHHFLFDIEIRLKFSMNLLRKTNKKYIFTWEGSSATIHRCCLEKKTSLQATNDRRGDYPKKNLPDARLFSSLFLASPFRFFIVSGFPYLFLIKLYFKNHWAIAKKDDKFWIPKNKRKTN